MTSPVRVAVTGAAGQIGYSLLFRIAFGAMLGPETKVILQLLEITPAMGALSGVKMELDDCAFAPLVDVITTDDLSANGGIFKPQGQAISRNAKKDVKVLVVGNPANTNALIAMHNASDIAPRQFTAMTRLDHNRAISQIAARVQRPVTSVKKMTIWGNHSTTQYPDLFHCEVDGKNAAQLVNDQKWIDETYIPTVAKRGAAVIKARGSSSAASAANAAIDHVRSWVKGTPEGDWVSMAVPSDGSYGVPEGLISSFPCVCSNGEYSIVQGLDIDAYSRSKIDASVAELMEERDAVKQLGLI